MTGKFFDKLQLGNILQGHKCLIRTYIHTYVPGFISVDKKSSVIASIINYAYTLYKFINMNILPSLATIDEFALLMLVRFTIANFEA